MVGKLTQVIHDKSAELGGSKGPYEQFRINEKTLLLGGNSIIGRDDKLWESFDSRSIKLKPDIPYYSLTESQWCTKRYMLAVLTSIGFMISFGIRCNLGVAIVEMVKPDPVTKERLFDWDSVTSGIVESSYFWGYLITQIPGGFLAAKYPATLIFGTAIAASAAINMFVPAAALVSAGFLMFVRFLQGLVEGVTYPACHGIWRWWAPPLERSRLATLAFCGSYGGAVVGMPVCGLLVGKMSWQAPFYFYGALGLIWYSLWLWLTFEKPSKHPTISAEELHYIEKSIGHVSPKPLNVWTTPWKQIFGSKPVYAIIVANFCRSWTFYLLLLSEMTYLSQEFRNGVATGGFLGALPHLLMTMVVPIGGILADYCRRKNVMTTTQVRKVFNCGGFGMEAFFLILVAVAKRNEAFALSTLTMAVGVSGFAISGFSVNHLDIAPRYAGILMGISNGVGTVAGMLCPIVVQWITTDKHNGWEEIFLLSAFLHICGVIFYGFFASGEIQPWADLPSEYHEVPEVTEVKLENTYGSKILAAETPPPTFYQAISTLSPNPFSQWAPEHACLQVPAENAN